MFIFLFQYINCFKCTDPELKVKESGFMFNILQGEATERLHILGLQASNTWHFVFIEKVLTSVQSFSISFSFLRAN